MTKLEVNEGDDEGGITLHRNGIIIELNETIAAMLGYRPGEMIAASLHEVFSDFEPHGAWIDSRQYNPCARAQATRVRPHAERHMVLELP